MKPAAVKAHKRRSPCCEDEARRYLAEREAHEPRCSECGVPIAEHPDTDACALAQEARKA